MTGYLRRAVVGGVRRPVGARSGVSLVELLVATVIATVVLAGAWAWLWNVGVASSSTADRTRAATAAAFVVRSMAADLDASASLQSPPPAYAASIALSVLHVHPEAAPESVLIVWDSTRRVLWRKAPGTYLADDVTSFEVSYLDAAGQALSPADLAGPAGLCRVARVNVRVVVSAGHESAEAQCDVTLRQR